MHRARRQPERLAVEAQQAFAPGAENLRLVFGGPRADGIRPCAAWIEHGWWPADFPYGHSQDLLPPLKPPSPDMLSASFALYWEMWREYAEIAAPRHASVSASRMAGISGRMAS